MTGNIQFYENESIGREKKKLYRIITDTNITKNFRNSQGIEKKGN